VKRLLPKSLLGQMILLMGAALLVAQLVNFAFIFNGQQRLNLAQNEGPAISRFVQMAGQVATATPAQRAEILDRPGRRFRSYALGPASNVGGERDQALERRLANGLADAGVSVRAVRAARISGRETMRGGDEPDDFRRGRRWQTVFLSAQLPDGQWLNGRLPVPRPDRFLGLRLALATLALYVLVFGAMLWIAARINRPLRDLTRAAESFQGRQEAAPVAARGPADVRRAIEAFNAMNQRVTRLLDEKDRMLGAIGHDLRTPLASIRIRAEGMEPAEEREAITRTVAEMSDTLEDILVLARTGRAREPARLMDLSALVEAVAEDYEMLGADVGVEDSPRLPATVQPNLLRRAVRNLIDNAVKYGTRARVRVLAEGAGAAIEIDDDGPGIPDDQIEAVLRPFERLEASRNRDTGGAGLGLAIASAVAETHGGTLTLANRPDGGLRARMVLPA
jgi:signal transduction histidine kinase